MPSQVLVGYVSEKQMAEQIGRCERTLVRWRKQGVAPPHTLVGRQVLYNVETARTWLANGGTCGITRRQRKTR
jgi:hypothetical protein